MHDYIYICKFFVCYGEEPILKTKRGTGMTDLFTEYEAFEKRSGSLYNRRCIDGRITGCGNCVGYCKFEGHSGFLTKPLRKEHNCIFKACRYYVPKERSVRRNSARQSDG